MATIRVVKTKNFTVVSNKHLLDKRLSLKAKGIMTLMLSLPDDWDFSVRGLVSMSCDGYNATATALNELEECGYLVREKVRDGGKFSDVEYALYEEPQEPCAENQQTGETENTEKQTLNGSFSPLSENPTTEKPITENPITENPITEKPTTENQTNKILYKQNTNKPSIKSECAPARTHTREEPIEGLSGSRPVSKTRFVPPTLDEVRAYIDENGFHVNSDAWYAHYESNGWMVGKSQMKNWRAAVRTWEHNGINSVKATPPPGNSGLASSFDTDDFFEAAMRRSGMLNENESEEKKKCH